MYHVFHDVVLSSALLRPAERQGSVFVFFDENGSEKSKKHAKM